MQRELNQANMRAGATLFHFATGGLHPYGDTGDPELIPRIIGDRKVNFDKVCSGFANTGY